MACTFLSFQSPGIKLLNTSAANLNLKIFHLSAFVGFSGSFRTGWPSCDKRFPFGGSQKAAEAAGKSNQSLSTCLHHTLSSESLIYFWTEIICLFCFLSHSKLLPQKLNLMPRGMMEKFGKITFSQNSAFHDSNEWQNKITVGDAILCWLAVLSIYFSSIHVSSANVNIGNFSMTSEQAFFN